MKILFVIAEASPFVKTGGLGDVGGSLPAALQSGETEVRVILPKYTLIKEDYLRRLEPVAEFTVELAWRKISCIIERLKHEGIVYYFVGSDFYFNRSSIYGYEDDAERFAFFCKAVLTGLVHLDYQPDILHCNDWHTALVPLLLQENFGNDPYYFRLKTILTIHNLQYQGFAQLACFQDVLGLNSHTAAWEKLELNGSLNYLKAGILAVDMITTVSPTYAQEIQDSYYGGNLQGILRQRKASLYGILNGIDTELFNPAKDPRLSVRYRSSLAGKRHNKKDLQDLLYLPSNGGQPLLAIVSRLVEQKGIDLVIHILDELLSMDVQLVVLGVGEKRYEESLRWFSMKYPDKMALKLGFDEILSHKIYAGADLLLMPSRIEPCGLAQMIAMRYGTLPVVRETGGLKDSVVPYNEFTGAGTGFSFANYNAHELMFTVKRALQVYHEGKDAWRGLVRNALFSDFSWRKSACHYRELYQSLTDRAERG